MGCVNTVFRLPTSAAARRPSTVSNKCSNLLAEKYGAMGRPVVLRKASLPPSRAAKASHKGVVRRSFHTIALWYGFPVRLFHTTVVSRWLVMPIAAMSAAVKLALVNACVTHFCVLSRSSIGSCSD